MPKTERPADPQPSSEGRDSHRATARSAGPVAASGVVVNLVVAGTTLAIARLLDPSEYGTFVQLVAVFYVLTMPGLALGIAVVRRLSDWLARPTRVGAETREAEAKIAAWVHAIRRKVYLGCVAAFLVGALLAAPIAHVLAIHSTSGLVETFAAGALWTVVCFERAILQAHKAYPAFAANLLLEGLVRCAALLAAVGVGLGVTGAAAGLLISLPVAIGHARWEQHRLVARENEQASNPTAAQAPDGSRPVVPEVGPQRVGRARHDALIALAALGLLAVLQNVDVLVLGRRDPGSSGSYGAISVASKALVLIAFVLAGFLLPEAATRRAAGHHALSPLFVSMVFIAVPAALLLIASVSEGHELLSIAFGKRLAGASAAFAPLALAMTLLATSVVLTHYLLAAGSRVVVVVLLVAAIATTLALALTGSGPQRVAWTDVAAQGLLAVALGVLVAAHHHRVHRRSTASRYRPVS